MQSLHVSRTRATIAHSITIYVLAAVFAVVLAAAPIATYAQSNTELNISVSQDVQNWPLKSGAGVKGGVPTDVVYYVTDTPANNALNARFWNQNYLPKSQTDSGGGEQNYIISQGATTLLGNTVHYPTGALPAHFLVTQPNESESYLYFVTGSSLFGPPVTERDASVLTASYNELLGLQNISGWNF